MQIIQHQVLVFNVYENIFANNKNYTGLEKKFKQNSINHWLSSSAQGNRDPQWWICNIITHWMLNREQILNEITIHYEQTKGLWHFSIKV